MRAAGSSVRIGAGARGRTRTALVAAGALGALVLSTAAIGAASFTDPAGDNNAAPDITSVTVSETPEGVLTLAAVVANYPALPPGSWVNVWFDLDNNPSTGDDGDEAWIHYEDDGGLQLYRWVGNEMVRRQTTGMTAAFAAGTLTVTLPTTAIDNMAGFGLLVVTSRADMEDPDEEIIASDYSPNRGRARYVAPGPLSVTDAAGDMDAAPDITGVQVADTPAGTITFTVQTPSHPAIAQDDWIELDFDIDRRRSTGDNGVEAYVGLDGGGVYAGRWDPAKDDFAEVRRSGAHVRSAGGVTTFSVPRPFLDDVASFDFYLVSGDWDPDAEEDDALDWAPDGEAWWKYSLVNKAPLRLIAGDARGIPAKPAGGKQFTVLVPVTRSDTARPITAGAVACDLTVAGERVQVKGRVAAGTARCSVKVPAGASGSALRGSMLVRSGGKSVKTGFAFRVR
jgi:hypothetical protein